jgi:hypothetical protein
MISLTFVQAQRYDSVETLSGKLRPTSGSSSARRLVSIEAHISVGEREERRLRGEIADGWGIPGLLRLFA